MKRRSMLLLAAMICAIYLPALASVEDMLRLSASAEEASRQTASIIANRILFIFVPPQLPLTVSPCCCAFGIASNGTSTGASMFSSLEYT